MPDELPIASGMPARVNRNANEPALVITNMITALGITDRVSVQLYETIRPIVRSGEGPALGNNDASDH